MFRPVQLHPDEWKYLDEPAARRLPLTDAERRELSRLPADLEEAISWTTREYQRLFVMEHAALSVPQHIGFPVDRGAGVAALGTAAYAAGTAVDWKGQAGIFSDARAEFLCLIGEGEKYLIQPARDARATAASTGRMQLQEASSAVRDKSAVLDALLAYLSDSPHVWRYMLAISAVPAVLLGLGMMLVPKSPRWLAGQGRMDEARAVLGQIRSSDKQIETEMAEMTRLNTIEREQAGWSAVLGTPWIRKLLWIGIGLGFTAQFTGINAFMYFTPIILTSTGLGTNAALTATIGNGVVSVIATLIGIWLIGKHGRRPMLMTGLGGVILTQAALGIVLTWFPEGLARSYAALACILCFLLCMQMLVAPVYWLLMSELFPMHVRGVLTGTAVACQWVFNALVALLFPIALAQFGSATFFVFAAINIASLAFVATCVPETRGKSLEGLERHLEKTLSAGA